MGACLSQWCPCWFGPAWRRPRASGPGRSHQSHHFRPLLDASSDVTRAKLIVRTRPGCTVALDEADNQNMLQWAAASGASPVTSARNKRTLMSVSPTTLDLLLDGSVTFAQAAQWRT